MRNVFELSEKTLLDLDMVVFCWEGSEDYKKMPLSASGDPIACPIYR